VYKTSKQCNME